MDKGEGSMKNVGITMGLAGLLALPWLSFDALASPSCEKRNNNTQKKLQKCVTVEGVREHVEPHEFNRYKNDQQQVP